jgi:hypothetical protein
MSRFKKRFCVLMLAVAILNLALGFLNPILCVESDGRIQLEFLKSNQCLISDKTVQKNENDILFSNCAQDSCFDTPALGHAVSASTREMQHFNDPVLFERVEDESLSHSLKQVGFAWINFDKTKSTPAFVESFLGSVIILI